MEDVLQALQDKVDELEAVRACFPDLLHLAPAEADNLRFAAAVAAGGSAAAPADVPALSGCLQLPEVQLGGAPVLLKFVLGSPPSLAVIASASRADADSLQQLATAVAAECAADGAPCLLLAADRLAAAAAELAEAEAAERQQAGAQQVPAAGCQQQQQQRQHGQVAAAAAGSGGRELVLSRRCVWFHHIKSERKRKFIVEWGRELGLGGFSKPGFPGVLLVEGAGDDVDEYLGRLRALRWQAMAVRGEQDLPLGSSQEVEAARRLPRGVQELGEEDMGRLAAAAREAGLEGLFLTALKLAPH